MGITPNWNPIVGGNTIDKQPAYISIIENNEKYLSNFTTNPFL